jgi:DNA-directed RNA polymerase specialized sigma24 family protein
VNEVDPVLRPFLQEPDDAATRGRLGEILEREASPVAWRVIRAQLRGSEASDLEDVHAAVILRLARHLLGLRVAGNPEEPVRAFAAYVAAVAHNACHAFLRVRSPDRARLRSRTRYVLTRAAPLALWENGTHSLCGQAAWRGAAWNPATVERLSDLSRRIGAFAGPQPDGAAMPFPRLVESLLARLQGPARFEDVVDALAAILGITDRPATAPRSDDGPPADPLDDLAAPGASPEDAIVQRDFLTRVWVEIQTLPLRQRAALLLNLRDPDGRGMIGLFPLTETATVAELARALEIPEDRFQTVWSDLPWEDEGIARWMGVTRRQVINLRKCARERLARRLRRAGW